jgi:UDP-N-acetylglucosamine--N-acetylmuramyl-(pentapeptide) pyrophosphoryl-undecaprenol N-acetylglucosamine transferase
MSAVVWVVAGGTAGHLHAGIALAHELAHDADALLVAGDRPVEDVALAEVSLHTLRLAGAGLVRLGALPEPAALAANVRALRRAPAPTVAVGLGGAHEVLALGVARMRGARIVLVEQNAVLGRANRLLAPLASTLALAWPTRVPRIVQARAVVVGHPARPLPRRDAARAALGVDPGRPFVVVTSGSLGSLAINEAVVALEQAGALDGMTLWHFCGERNIPAEVPPSTGGYRAVVGFDPHLGEAIAAADLVVSRAGSSTIAEITQAGVASVLVPLPTAPGDHQAANAALLARMGAARVVPEGPRFTQRLGEALGVLARDQACLAAMGRAARSLWSPGATERLGAEVRRWLT